MDTNENNIRSSRASESNPLTNLPINLDFRLRTFSVSYLDQYNNISTMN